MKSAGLGRGVALAAAITVRWMEGDTLKVGGPGDLATARAADCVVWVDVLDPDAESLAPIADAVRTAPARGRGLPALPAAGQDRHLSGGGVHRVGLPAARATDS